MQREVFEGTSRVGRASVPACEPSPRRLSVQLPPASLMSSKLEYRRAHSVPFSVKSLWFWVITALLVVGCKTSTIESRIEKRSEAFAALPPEIQADVHAGRIRVGMNSDAVYMSWGQPAQVLESGGPQGNVTTWLYEGGWMQEQRYWTYRTVGTGKNAWAERVLEREYYPRA